MRIMYLNKIIIIRTISSSGDNTFEFSMQEINENLKKEHSDDTKSYVNVR